MLRFFDGNFLRKGTTPLLLDPTTGRAYHGFSTPKIKSEQTSSNVFKKA
jgi:hypothetical protein